MHQQYNIGAMRRSENGIYFQVHLDCMKTKLDYIIIVTMQFQFEILYLL